MLHQKTSHLLDPQMLTRSKELQALSPRLRQAHISKAGAFILFSSYFVFAKQVRV